MVTIVVRLADLKLLSSLDSDRELSGQEVVAALRKQFDYLPGDVQIELRDDTAVIRFEGPSPQRQTEARRLFGRAGKKAREGDYRHAAELYRRIIDIDPAMADARRELAMTYMELGDVQAAKDQLVDALCLKPDDAWSYVVLGNIYVKHDQDLDVARRFFTRALELKPGDPYALNSLAAVSTEQGDPAHAIQCFDQAIATHPEFANAWAGKAMLLLRQGQPMQATTVLEAMFGRAKAMDARSLPVFAEARQLYLSAQTQLAEVQLPDAYLALEGYKADIAQLSGYSVTTRSEIVPGELSGVAQMAWKHGRDYHLIQIRSALPPPDAQHTEAHELTHIRLEALARQSSRNRWFATSAASREKAIRAIASDIRRLERDGYAPDSITRVVLELVQGVCGFLFNAPLDMWVETLIRRDFPSLRPAQFVSLHRLANEGLKATVHPDIRKRTPLKILRAITALNGAQALFLDEFTHGISDFWSHYRDFDSASTSQRLFQRWKDHRDQLQPGDEYELVDEFAEILGMQGWYEWKSDSGKDENSTGEAKTGTSNPVLLQEKHPAAVWHLLDALQRFDPLPVDKVREIATEIATLGQQGLDYASPEKQYSLRSLPGESFSGLQLMCLMYAGFKRVTPDADPGMDLHEPFLQAMKLFDARRGGS
jgi:Tfp pilus assembly protein PilF